MKNFPDLSRARKCLNIKIKNGITLQYSWCYTIAACFPFEPLEKCMTLKDIFPGLSRTLSFDFQDQSNFPGLSRSWNFQENPRLSRTFVGTLHDSLTITIFAPMLTPFVNICT